MGRLLTRRPLVDPVLEQRMASFCHRTECLATTRYPDLMSGSLIPSRLSQGAITVLHSCHQFGFIAVVWSNQTGREVLALDANGSVGSECQR